MLGRAKCKILKEIRQKIADENDIPYVTRECTYQGDCSGTCPKCESELRYLERELENRQRLGKAVAVTALCTGLTANVTACSSPFGPDREMGGDVAAPIEDDVDLRSDKDRGGDDTLSGEAMPEELNNVPDAEGFMEYDPDIAGGETYDPEYDPHQDLSGAAEVDPDYYELEGDVPNISYAEKTPSDHQWYMKPRITASVKAE